MRRGVQACGVVGLVLLLAGSVGAQQRQRSGGRGGFGGSFGGPAMLLQNASVRDELKLTGGVADRVRTLIESVREKHRDEYDKIRQLDWQQQRDAYHALARTVSEETEKALLDVLRPDQMKRLKQIGVQLRGVQAFTDSDIQKALTLTEEQVESLKAIGEDAAKGMREIFQAARGFSAETQKKIAALRQETLEKSLGVLKADQLSAWQDLTGEPFTVRFDRPGRVLAGNRPNDPN